MAGREMFTKSGDVKVDAHLHDVILKNPQAEKALASARAARLAAKGLTAQEIVDTFG